MAAKHRESVHSFLRRLRIPEENIQKVKEMHIMARGREPIHSKMYKKELTSKDCNHTLLLEVVKETGHKNLLLVFISPKTDHDKRGDGKPYRMTGDWVGEDTWSSDEETDRYDRVYDIFNHDKPYLASNNTNDNTDDDDDEDADEEYEEDDEVENEEADKNVDQAADDHAEDADEEADETDDQADDEADDRVPDGHYDSTSEDLAYFSADDSTESEN